MIPITFAMFLIGILRHLVSKLLRGKASPQLKTIQAKQRVQRAQTLRMHGHFLTRGAFAQRKAYFCDKEHGILNQKVDASLNPQQQMMSDPNMMTDMLKKNMGMIVPQIVTGAWVNFFFSGFVVAKVPFPLTQRFRVMLQRGIDLAALDVTYISSLSWYFMCLFGLSGTLNLVMGEKTFDDAARMTEQMAGGMGGGGMGVDMPNVMKGERDALMMYDHKFLVPERFMKSAIDALAI